MLLQVLLIGASIGLVVVGIKGFTASGLAISKTKNLTGTPAKVLGTICIAAGLGLIPLFMLLMWSLSS